MSSIQDALKYIEEYDEQTHLEYVIKINKIYQQSRNNNRKVINELKNHIIDFYNEKEYYSLGLPNWIYTMSKMRKDFKKNKKIVFVNY